MEKLEEKTKQAQESFYRAFKEELAEKDYEIVDYIFSEDLQKDDFDNNLATVLGEIDSEFHDAEYSLKKNIEEEKNKPFSYSIGLRAKELSGLLSKNPDIFLLITPYGLINNLAAFEAPTVATMAVLTLGASLLAPAPDDVLGIDVAFIAAGSGDIIWYNSQLYYGRTLLSYPHIKDVIKKTLRGLPDAVSK